MSKNLLSNIFYRYNLIAMSVQYFFLRILHDKHVAVKMWPVCDTPFSRKLNVSEEYDQQFCLYRPQLKTLTQI